MKVIINGRIYKDYEFLQNKALIYDEKIFEVVEQSNIAPEQFEEVLDAKGLLILPGFIDIHHHGYNGYDTMDDSDEALIHMQSKVTENGVTSFLPTTMTMNTERIHQSLDRIRHLMAQKNKGARVLGAHVEGPFISNEYKGAQSDTYIQMPNHDLIEGYKDVVKIITIAPELPGSMPFIKDLSDRGITVSIGHTAADYETMQQAFLNGGNGNYTLVQWYAGHAPS